MLSSIPTVPGWTEASKRDLMRIPGNSEANSESSVANIEETHVGPVQWPSTPLEIATDTRNEAKVPLFHDEFAPTPSRFGTPRARHARDALEMQLDTKVKESTNDQMALINASESGNTSRVRLLLGSAGANVNARDALEVEHPLLRRWLFEQSEVDL